MHSGDIRFSSDRPGQARPNDADKALSCLDRENKVSTNISVGCTVFNTYLITREVKRVRADRGG